MMSDTSSDTRVFRFAVLTIAAMLTLNVVVTIFVKGWGGAAFNTALVSLVYLAYAIRIKNPMLSNWLIVALAAGFTELLADWWLVVKTESLVYAPGPKIVVSPIYMPFAWMLVVVQVALVGQWFARRFPKPLAAFMTGALAGVNIPFYESLAKLADWWYYQGTPMFLNAPYYIILGEFLIGVPLVYLGAPIAERTRPALAVAIGAGVGLVIFVAYYVAWGLVG